MPNEKQKRKIAGVVLGVAALGATAGTIYVLIENDNKSNEARKQLALSVDKLKELKNSLSDKPYANALSNEVEQQIAKYEEILQDPNIKDANTIFKNVDEAKNDLANDIEALNNLETLNQTAKKAVDAFDNAYSELSNENQNNAVYQEALKQLAKDNAELKEQYANANNADDLNNVIEQAKSLTDKLEAIKKLGNAITDANSLLNELPADFENKSELTDQIAKAQEVLNNPASTTEELKAAQAEVENELTKFQNALNGAKAEVIEKINKALENAKAEKESLSNDPLYSGIVNNLENEINTLASQANNNTSIDGLNALLEKANNLVPNAEATKSALDNLKSEITKAENQNANIESAKDLFNSADVETYKQDVEKAKELLKSLNTEDIKAANETLKTKNDEFANKISEQEAELKAKISETADAVKTFANTLTNEADAALKQSLLSDADNAINPEIQADKNLGDLKTLNDNLKNELSQAKVTVSKEALAKTIADSKKLLNQLKEENLVNEDRISQYESDITTAQAIYDGEHSQNDLEKLAEIYKNAADSLTSEFNNKIVSDAKSSLDSAKSFETEMEESNSKAEWDASETKKDLEYNIHGLEASLNKTDPAESNDVIVAKWIDLDKSLVSAKEFKNSQQAAEEKLKAEIKQLKDQIGKNVDSLTDEKAALENTKYNSIANELENVLNDYNQNDKPNLDKYSKTELSDIKNKLQQALDNIPNQKAAIDREMEELTNQLNNALTQANQTIENMPGDDYNPNKQTLQDSITKAGEETNINTVDKLKAIIKELNDNNAAAQNKIAEVNKQKQAIIDQIDAAKANITNNLIPSQSDENQKAALENAVKAASDDNAPTLQNSISELNDKLQALNEAINNNQSFNEKEALENAISEAKNLATSITSQDPKMTELQTSLNDLAKEAQDIIDGQESSKYVSETQKINDAIEAAKKKIDEFKKSEAADKLNHANALQAANDLLNNLKTDSNKANLGSVIDALEQAINANSNIEDNSPLTDIEAKVNALNQAIDAANAAKAQADSETNEKLAQLKSAIDSANELSDQMSDPVIASAKEKLSNAIATAQQAYDANPKQTNEQIESATSAINAAKQEAQTALDNLNKEKSALKEQINANAEDIKNYINNTLNNPEYAEIKKDLQAALDNFNNVQKPLLDSETKAKLEQIKNQLNTALEAAKEKKTQKDKEIAGSEKAALENAIKASKSISNNITDQDPEMVELKNKLEAAQAEAQKVVDGNQEQNYASETAKINALNEEAQAAIAKFNDKLSTAKTTHAETLKAANDLLNSLKSDSNKVNLGSVINALTQAINTPNSTINDGDTLSSIEAKTAALKEAIKAANEGKELEDNETNEALKKLEKEMKWGTVYKQQLSTDNSLQQDLQKYEKALQKASDIYNADPKKTNEVIQQATADLKAARNEAFQVFREFSEEKGRLIKSIVDNRGKLQKLADSMTAPEYKSLVDKINSIIENVPSNESDENLNKLQKAELQELDNKLKKALADANQEKSRIDAEQLSAARNELSQNLSKAKEAVNNLDNVLNINSSQSDNPVSASEQQKLKDALNKAISEAESANDTNAINEANAALKEATNNANTFADSQYRSQLNKIKNNAETQKTEYPWSSTAANVIIDGINQVLNKQNPAATVNELEAAYNKYNDLNNRLNQDVAAWKTQAEKFTSAQANVAKLKSNVDKVNATQAQYNSVTAIKNAVDAQNSIQLNKNWDLKQLTEQTNQSINVYDAQSKALKSNQNAYLNTLSEEINKLKAPVSAVEKDLPKFADLGITSTKLNELSTSVIKAREALNDNTYDYSSTIPNIKNQLPDFNQIKPKIDEINLALNKIKYINDSATILNNNITASNSDASLAADKALPLVNTEKLTFITKNTDTGLPAITNQEGLNDLLNKLTTNYTEQENAIISKIKNNWDTLKNGTYNGLGTSNPVGLNDWYNKLKEVFKWEESTLTEINQLQNQVTTNSDLTNIENQINNNATQIEGIQASTKASNTDYLSKSAVDLLKQNTAEYKNAINNANDEYQKLLTSLKARAKAQNDAITKYQNDNRSDALAGNWVAKTTSDALNAEKINDYLSQTDVVTLARQVVASENTIGKAGDRISTIAEKRKQMYNMYRERVFGQTFYSLMSVPVNTFEGQRSPFAPIIEKFWGESVYGSPDRWGRDAVKQEMAELDINKNPMLNQLNVTTLDQYIQNFDYYTPMSLALSENSINDLKTALKLTDNYLFNDVLVKNAKYLPASQILQAMVPPQSGSAYTNYAGYSYGTNNLPITADGSNFNNYFVNVINLGRSLNVGADYSLNNLDNLYNALDKMYQVFALGNQINSAATVFEAKIKEKMTSNRADDNYSLTSGSQKNNPFLFANGYAKMFNHFGQWLDNNYSLIQIAGVNAYSLFRTLSDEGVLNSRFQLNDPLSIPSNASQEQRKQAEKIYSLQQNLLNAASTSGISVPINPNRKPAYITYENSSASFGTYLDYDFNNLGWSFMTGIFPDGAVVYNNAMKKIDQTYKTVYETIRWAAEENRASSTINNKYILLNAGGTGRTAGQYGWGTTLNNTTNIQPLPEIPTKDGIKVWYYQYN
ncbi:hypothetical protein [Metamycoplasma neophronis]|uniref:Uncharacterized protein n=1 Tax=Metamycoplasma neophronis TaxID=872983 RepID=A0ABY2YZR2_9BACT|nr:hypothetical protein [Metamycoplasma neophronis]TPR53257.1 hypothetical protein FJR74_02950 [Metamycoplasma neophronis]